MKRWRNRYSRDSFCRTMIVGLFLVGGLNSLLLAGMAHVKGNPPIAPLIVGGCLLLRGSVWIFEERPGNRSMNIPADVAVVAALWVLLFGAAVIHAGSWLMAALLAIECLLFIRFYLRNRPERR